MEAVGINEIDPLHDSSVLEIEAWDFAGDQCGGGLCVRFKDLGFEIVKAVGFTECGYSSELFKLTIFLAVGGCFM